MRRASLAAACSLLLAGCLYSFTGGGLPPGIRTLAVTPFENGTAEPVLGTDVHLRLQDQVPRKLGVRLADQRVADAVLRGRITGFDETTPAFSANPQGQRDRINVVMREVRITFEAEIYDVRQDRSLWKGSGVTAIGNYQPGSEQSQTGRVRAIDQMVQKIIEGAQSQW
ncbi:MAG TPA: LPS assembly lipoprotein LptE [Longimicrobiaceae bacterium]|nr:LPS assembly lipoprotein LptE [Longimicrobiaceae bacterium]